MKDNMRARLLLDERHDLRENAFAELRIWQVPIAVRASEHTFKYSLAYVVDSACVLRFDNEAGKGDHKHVGAVESGYSFISIDKLLEDFWSEVDQWQTK